MKETAQTWESTLVTSFSRTSTGFLNRLADPRDEYAWHRFKARYVPLLLSCGRRMGLADADTQDAVAETLATAFEKFRTGDYQRERGRLKSWLGGIMFNKARKIRDRAASSPRGDLSADAESAGLRDTSAEERLHAAIETEWRLERLNRALPILRARVEPTTYQAFDLYCLKDWPAAKVAEFLAVARNVVFISKTRCIQMIKEIIADQPEEENA